MVEVAAPRRLCGKLRRMGVRVSANAPILVYTADRRVLEAVGDQPRRIVVEAPRIIVMIAGLLRLPIAGEGIIAADCRAEQCGEARKLSLSLLELLRILVDMLMYTEVGRMARFAVVGASGVPVNLAAWLLLVRVFHMARPGEIHGYALPDLLASEVAILWNFAWNEWWTFSDLQLPRSPASIASRLIRYNVITLIGVGLLILIHGLLMELGLSDVDAYLTAILLVFVFNYVFSRLLAWRGGGRPG